MIENFGFNVSRIRKEQNMTQKELAEKIGVNKQTISNIEKGEGYPSFKNLEKLSQTLNATPIQLFGTMKEIVLSDTPRILEKIDAYDVKIKNILNAELFLNTLSSDKIDELITKVEFVQNSVVDYNFIFNSFSDVMKSKRLELNMTQSELAELVSVSEKTIQNYETKKTLPNLKTMEKLLTVLDLGLLKKDGVSNEQIY